MVKHVLQGSSYHTSPFRTLGECLQPNRTGFRLGPHHLVFEVNKLVACFQVTRTAGMINIIIA